MGGLQWILDLGVIGLLAATLFHAIRLERALGVLKRDRTMLEQLVGEFNMSTREAQIGIDRLREAADGAGRSLVRQTDSAVALRDDMAFLIERGEQLADRLDQLIRAGRHQASDPAPMHAAPSLASRPTWAEADAGPPLAAESPPRPAQAATRVRSQAERDLLAALRVAR